MSSTDWKALLAAARDQGWTVVRDRRHIVLHGPDGHTIIVLPSTPGRGRAFANAVSLFRKAGGRFQGR